MESSQEHLQVMMFHIPISTSNKNLVLMQKTLHGWQGVQREIVLLLTQSQKLA